MNILAPLFRAGTNTNCELFSIRENIGTRVPSPASDPLTSSDPESHLLSDVWTLPGRSKFDANVLLPDNLLWHHAAEFILGERMLMQGVKIEREKLTDDHLSAKDLLTA
jgi:hypothetical protein